MAYMCESHIYKPIFERNGDAFPYADDYPYGVCKILAKIIYPEFLESEILLVAACDISLMTYHPGLSFVRLLEHLKQIKFLSTVSNDGLKIIEKLYTEGHRFLKGSHADFAKLQDVVKASVRNNFKCDEFEGNNAWIDVVFTRANILRTEIPQFITDMLLFGEGIDIRENQFFRNLLEFLGSSLIVNEANEGAISLPINFSDKTFMPGLYWAINQVLRVFANDKALPCELKEHCKRSAIIDSYIKIDVIPPHGVDVMMIDYARLQSSGGIGT